MAMAVAKEIYRVTGAFPSDERFGLVNQMRRAAVFIASNIAEGHERGTTAEFQRFVQIAMGSLAELETQVLLSKELGFLKGAVNASLLSTLDILGKNLRSLHQALTRHKSR